MGRALWKASVFLLLVTLMELFGSLSADGGPGGWARWTAVAGLPLVVAGGWLLQAGAATEPPKRPACATCGREARPGARFCDGCGALL